MADLAALLDLTPSEYREMFGAVGLTQAHRARVAGAMARAAMRLVGADNPSKLLVDKVNQSVARAMRRELRAVMADIADAAEREALGVTFDTREAWQSVIDDRRCEDCEARHGHIQTHAQWEADGLPRSGNTVCGSNCRCRLIPATMMLGAFDEGPGDVQVTVSLEVA